MSLYYFNKVLIHDLISIMILVQFFYIFAYVLAVVVFLLIIWYLKTYEARKLAKLERKRQKTIDASIEKYIPEEKKDVMKQKMSQISRIVEETEKHIELSVKKKVEVAEKQLSQIIQRAGEQYKSYMSGFQSATPRTEEERQQDLEDLKFAMEALDGFGEESEVVPAKRVDIGLGMFYENMSRRFQKIIKDNELDKYDFIPSQMMKYYAFTNIRNIKNDDILPILKIMKETNLLSDLIKVNPPFHLIVFKDLNYEFTNQERVLLSLAYDNPDLNKEQLLELTEWKEDYATKILEGLAEKGVINLVDEIINIGCYCDEQERREWERVINEQMEKERLKDDEKFQKQLETRKKIIKSFEQK